MNWKLWIDDEAFDEGKPYRNPPEGYFAAINVEDAIKITKILKSPPEFLHLDHDLGKGPNVMEYLKFLFEAYPTKCPEYIVHSANCVGRDNIISYLDSWKKSLDLKERV